MLDTDLHIKMLELSDDVGRLNKRILENGESNFELCFGSSALIEEYGARLDEIRKERLRRNGRRNADEQETSSTGV